MRRPASVGLALAIASSACATSPDKARSEAANLAGERLERMVSWEQSTEADREVDRRVRELLAGELSPEAAVEIALVRNPELLADLENLGIAQADLVEAGLLDNIHLGGGPRFSLATPTALAWEFDAAVSFIHALLIPLKRKVAKAQLRDVTLRIAHAVLELDTHVREAVFDAIAAERTLEFRQAAAELAEAAAELARRQAATGVAGTLNELKRSELEAAEAEARGALQLAQVAVVEAREHLVRALGIFGKDVEFRLPKALPKLPDDDPDLGELERIAMRQRFDLQAQRAELDALSGAVRLARRNPFVQVDIGIVGETDPGDPTSLGPFFELEIPIFNWGQADVARAEAMLRQVERRLRGRAIDVRSEVRVQRARMVAERRLAEYERDRVVPMRKRMVELGQERYDAMLFSVYELIDLKIREFESRAELVEHLQGYFRARAELELAIGGRLESSIKRYARPKER